MYLLDTVVVPEYLRKKPAQQVIDWLDEQPEYTLYISSLTIAELNKGYHKLQHKAVLVDDKRRADKIVEWIEKLKQRFENRTISVDAKVLELWSKLCGHSEAEGKKLPVVDSLLVATALAHNLIIVTRNIADFQNCSPSIALFNPYS